LQIQTFPFPSRTRGETEGNEGGRGGEDEGFKKHVWFPIEVGDEARAENEYNKSKHFSERFCRISNSGGGCEKRKELEADKKVNV
jgi:hypothetical protein